PAHNLCLVTLVPDASTSFTSWLLLGPIIVFGYFVLGHLSLRWLHSPLPWLTAFIGSQLLLFFSVLVIDLTKLPLNLHTITGFLGLVSFICWKYAGNPSMFSLSCTWPSLRLPLRESWWLLPVGLACGSVLLRGLLQP